ncbi:MULTISPECIES: hypothetical protein [Bacillaceae]|uniref:hypothetical protein n=1 Tax=Bacillaceae TaxID=186817 RepID=UPI0015D63D2A|nr:MULTISPECIES: hypothetical protein [Bacillaceae]
MVKIRFHPDKYNLDDELMEDLYSAMTDWRLVVFDSLIALGFCIGFIFIHLS